MAMNREQKRAAQRQGLAGPDGAPITTRERPRPQQRLKEERVSPRQFISEVTSELKKTSWPTRQETIRLAIIVFIAIVVLTAFIFGLDLLFGEALTNLFDTTGDTTAAALPFLALPLRSRR